MPEVLITTGTDGIRIQAETPRHLVHAETDAPLPLRVALTSTIPLGCDECAGCASSRCLKTVHLGLD